MIIFTGSFGRITSNGEQKRVNLFLEIDECDIPQSCPAKSVCLNSIGTYSCTCNDGYRMRNSKCRGKSNTTNYVPYVAME